MKNLFLSSKLDSFYFFLCDKRNESSLIKAIIKLAILFSYVRFLYKYTFCNVYYIENNVS